MASVGIHNITKSFGTVPVLKDVSLDIEDGEFVSLVGPSGCGKSTLLRIIAGLETQDAGEIAIANTSVDRLRPAERNLAMVFQSYALYPHLTVAENIAMPLRMRRLTAFQRLPALGRFLPGSGGVLKDIGEDVRKAADLLDISHLLDRRPGQLSGGQRQRVAVGRALVRDPQAFLLDEPLSNLDAKLRVHMRTEIAQLHRHLSATFIYVTHDQAEAMTMSDRIAVMMDGEIIQAGSPEDIYDRPRDIRVAEFIGSPKINILPGETAPDGTVLLNGASLDMAVETDSRTVQLGVRPEMTALVDHGGLMTGTVIHAENLGAEILVQVGIEGLDAPVIARAPHGSGWKAKIGQTTGVSFEPESVLVFDGEGRTVASTRIGAGPQAAYG